MLVLSRKQGEVLRITDTQTGEIIRLAVIEFKPGKVKIGTEASSRFKILREELIQSSPEENAK